MVINAKNKDYECFIHSDLHEYEGKWVALVNGTVVASGDRADEVMMEAESKHPNELITLSKIPDKELMIL